MSRSNDFLIFKQKIRWSFLCTVFSRGHVTLHIAVSVGMSVGYKFCWIPSVFCISAPAQPSGTGLPCIQPCSFILWHTFFSKAFLTHGRVISTKKSRCRMPWKPLDKTFSNANCDFLPSFCYALHILDPKILWGNKLWWTAQVAPELFSATRQESV